MVDRHVDGVKKEIVLYTIFVFIYKIYKIVLDCIRTFISLLCDTSYTYSKMWKKALGSNPIERKGQNIPKFPL